MPFAAGQKPTASELNEAIDKPLFSTVQSAAQSIPNATWTAVTFLTEDIDTHGGHTTLPRYTAQVAGWYRITAKVVFVASATGARFARLLRNGAIVVPSGGNITPPHSDASVVNVLSVVQLAVSDYVELQAYQASGAALNTFWSAGGPEYRSAMLIECIRY